MKETSAGCDLKSCFFCSRCLPEWIPAISGNKKTFVVKKGESVFLEGNSVSDIFFVYKGTIKVHKRWDKEKELIIRFARGGDIIGYLGLGDEPNYPVSATALEDSMVCNIKISFFDTTLKVNPQLTHSLMRLFAKDLQDSQRSMRDLAHMSVRARIAKSFMLLEKQFGTNELGEVDVQMSRQDIASFSGTTYESLFKFLNEFAQQGILNLKGRRIRIKDKEALLKIISSDND